MAICHPKWEMPRSNKAGQATPATYWPEEISAIAAPRRRIEPAADIDQQRRVDAAVAQQPDHQPVADIERPDRADRRQGETARDHAGADHDGRADADAVGQPAHEDAAGTGADPDQRSRQRHQRARRCRAPPASSSCRRRSAAASHRKPTGSPGSSRRLSTKHDYRVLPPPCNRALCCSGHPPSVHLT